jgi:hypothetical protein
MSSQAHTNSKHSGHGSGHGHHHPFLVHVLAGGGAGLVEVLIMYPLDVVKTRWQLHHGSSRQSLFGFFADMVKNEGYLSLRLLLFVRLE